MLHCFDHLQVPQQRDCAPHPYLCIFVFGHSSPFDLLVIYFSETPKISCQQSSVAGRVGGRTCDCCSDHRPLTGPTVAAAGSATPQLVARRLPWLVRVHILRHRAHDACMRQPYPESDCPAHPEGEDADPDSVVPPARTGRCQQPLSRDQNKGSDQATPFR